MEYVITTFNELIIIDERRVPFLYSRSGSNISRRKKYSFDPYKQHQCHKDKPVRLFLKQGTKRGLFLWSQ